MDVNPISAIRKSVTYGRHRLTLETGEIARQAHGAVMVTMDDTCVLVTVVGRKEVKAGQDFFLTEKAGVRVICAVHASYD